MRLIDVLKRAGIPSGYLQTYFLDAHLAGLVLWIPEAVTARGIQRNFGDRLELALPGIRIQVGVVARPVKPSSGVPSYLNAKGVNAWKLQQATQPRLAEDE